MQQHWRITLAMSNCCLRVLILLYLFPVCEDLVVLACCWRQSCQLWLFCNNIYIYIYIYKYIHKHIIYTNDRIEKATVLALLPLLSSFLFTPVLKFPRAYDDMLQISLYQPRRISQSSPLCDELNSPECHASIMEEQSSGKQFLAASWRSRQLTNNNNRSEWVQPTSEAQSWMQGYRMKAPILLVHVIYQIGWNIYARTWVSS